MHGPLPDIYSHRLTNPQRVMLRIAAAVAVVVALLCVLVIFGHSPWPSMRLVLIALVALGLAISLWQERPGAILLLVFLLAVATMLSVAVGWQAVQVRDWRAVIVCGVIVAACAPYLKEFWWLCAKK